MTNFDQNNIFTFKLPSNTPKLVVAYVNYLLAEIRDLKLEAAGRQNNYLEQKELVRKLIDILHSRA